MGNKNNSKLQEALFSAWSLQSSTRWQSDNPALGQCGVTALVAQDNLGGVILKTRYGDLWHFYNLIEGVSVDFTASQFDDKITYDDIPANREEAFADTNKDQYDYLSSAVGLKVSSNTQ
ncbi:Uncharacterized protein YunG [hydrothermal vent metagenome]|uniref:Uncharacterized protein YunG n=1 Tax=hydrothermal vent metagenome TaxID=652676 RepID=A0A3B0SH77_9ZZZZ